MRGIFQNQRIVHNKLNLLDWRDLNNRSPFCVSSYELSRPSTPIQRAVGQSKGKC